MANNKLFVFVGVFIIGVLMFGLVSGAGYNIVVSSSSGDGDADSPGGGGGGDVPTYFPTKEKLIEGYTVILRKNYQVKFNVSGENHTLSVDSVGNDSVQITVSSEPQTKNLSVGGEEKFELDGDNFYDFSIKLNSISGTGAEFLMKTISEKIIKKEIITDTGGKNDSLNTTTSDEEKVLGGSGIFWVWFWWIVVFVVVIAGVAVYLKKRK